MGWGIDVNSLSLMGRDEAETGERKACNRRTNNGTSNFRGCF